MVDFAKIGQPREKVIVTYRCDVCGEEDDYVTEFPAGWRHEIRRNMTRCKGKLIEIGRRNA